MERLRPKESNGTGLDTPQYRYEDVARRYRVSHFTVRSWVQRRWLEPPVYLTAITARFTERQLLKFEQAAPRNHQEAGR